VTIQHKSANTLKSSLHGDFRPDESYQAIEKEGTLSEAGLQVQLADLAKTDPRTRTARPSDFLDASIIDELSREGFIKALWAK
jgi:hypothetical protein